MPNVSTPNTPNKVVTTVLGVETLSILSSAFVVILAVEFDLQKVEFRLRNLYYS